VVVAGSDQEIVDDVESLSSDHGDACFASCDLVNALLDHDLMQKRESQIAN
jgi:hypothetical protein